MSEAVSLEKQEIGSGGPLAFLQITEEDIERLAQSPIELAAWIVQNFLLKDGGDDYIRGAEILPTGGLTFEVRKPINIYRGVDGKHFEDFDLSPSAFTIPAPDTTNPRIDRVYAVLEENVDGLTELRHVNVNPADPDAQEADIN